jgi:quercetin dioxygenase-like cupin family protein
MYRPDSIPEFVKSLPEIDIPIPGARGWLLQGERHQVAFVEFSDNVEVPEHSHEDQWEIPVAGAVELNVDGDTRKYAPGDQFFLPAGKPHGARVHAGYRAIIVFDSPDRYTAKPTTA